MTVVYDHWVLHDGQHIAPGTPIEVPGEVSEGGNNVATESEPVVVSKKVSTRKKTSK